MKNAQINMIKQQIRTTNMFDEKILALLASLPREDFVPPEYRRLAFSDTEIPIGHQQYMMKPEIEAHMLSALSIDSRDKILEIGTGTGYITAALAKCGQFVTSLEIISDFLISAKERLNQLHITNISLVEGNAASGWEPEKPYDVICITGSLPVLPISFKEQLRVGGRLFAIIGKKLPMEAFIITRTGPNTWSEKKLFETAMTPLLKALEPDPFKF